MKQPAFDSIGNHGGGGGGVLGYDIMGRGAPQDASVGQRGGGGGARVFRGGGGGARVFPGGGRGFRNPIVVNRAARFVDVTPGVPWWWAGWGWSPGWTAYPWGQWPNYYGTQQFQNACAQLGRAIVTGAPPETIEALRADCARQAY